MSRRTLVLGKSAAAFLGLAIAWNALAAALGGMDFASSARAEESRFIQEIAVLAFIDRTDAKCETTCLLVDEMKRKNYPIQFVERANGGETLFEQYDVRTTPAFAFLVDGKEFKRFVVENEEIGAVRDRLLTLFRECRNKNSESVATRGQAPEYEQTVKRGVQNNFAQPKYGRTVAIPPKQEARTSTLSGGVASNGAAYYGRAAEPSVGSSDANAPNSRSGLTQIRAFVGVRGSSEERIGAGVVVHYNEEYGEALTLVPASLFTGVDDPLNGTNTTLDVVSSTSNSRERVVGQCVFCDVRSGLAFVAARVATPVAPVAFLPKNDLPRVGESAVVVAFNNSNECVPSKCEIISSDSETMRLAVGEGDKGQDYRGSGVFLVRNDRLYFSGLFTAIDAEGCGVVASVSMIDRTLLANSNLSTVYRDQVSGKYEALSLTSLEPQFSAPSLDSASRVDLNDAAPSTNMSDVFESAEIESDVINALSKLPAEMRNVPNDPNLRLDSPNAPTLDAAPVFANSVESRPSQTSVSDVPSVLKNTLDTNADVGGDRNAVASASNESGRSIALATNEDKSIDPRAQEIPHATRGVDGSFTDMDDVRSTNYASRQNDKALAPNDQETRLFESSLDELRRLSLEGAEIICIVNWGASSDGTRARETEVVRLPRRNLGVGAKATTATAFSSNVKSSVRNVEERRNVVPSQTTTVTGVSNSGFLR